MYLYYIKFETVLKKSEYDTWAIIAKDWEDAVEQVKGVGENPTLIGRPHKLNGYW